MFIQITKNYLKGTHIACRINLLGDEQIYEKYAVEIDKNFKKLNINIANSQYTEETIFFELEPNKIYEINGYYFNNNEWIKFEIVQSQAIENLNDIDAIVINSDKLPVAINQKPNILKDVI